MLVGQIGTLYGFLVDVSILGLNPDSFSIIGSIIIFIFTIIAIHDKNQQEKLKEAERALEKQKKVEEEMDTDDKK